MASGRDTHEVIHGAEGFDQDPEVAGIHTAVAETQATLTWVRLSSGRWFLGAGQGGVVGNGEEKDMEEEAREKGTAGKEKGKHLKKIHSEGVRIRFCRLHQTL